MKSFDPAVRVTTRGRRWIGGSDSAVFFSSCFLGFRGSTRHQQLRSDEASEEEGEAALLSVLNPWNQAEESVMGRGCALFTLRGRAEGGVAAPLCVF